MAIEININAFSKEQLVDAVQGTIIGMRNIKNKSLLNGKMLTTDALIKRMDDNIKLAMDVGRIRRNNGLDTVELDDLIYKMTELKNGYLEMLSNPLYDGN